MCSEGTWCENEASFVLEGPTGFIAALMLLASLWSTQKAWIQGKVPCERAIYLAESRPSGENMELVDMNSLQGEDNGSLWGIRNKRRKRSPEADLGTVGISLCCLY